VVPDFVDPASDGPLAGREDDWSLVTEYRVRLATEDRDWVEAERLQRVRVDWNRQRAQPHLAVTSDRRDATQRNAIRTLGSSLHVLAYTQREQDSPTCGATFSEAQDLKRASGDTPGQGARPVNHRHVYKENAYHGTWLGRS
jgi:hypothetical protein